MKALLSIGIAMLLYGLCDVYLDKIDAAYTRGFNAGVASVKKPDLDTACVAWWFKSNIKEIKKKICRK